MTRSVGSAVLRPGLVGAPGEAWFGGVRASEPVECIDLPAAAARLAQGGFWVVVGDFEGPVRAWRFAHVERGAAPTTRRGGGAQWRGPASSAWTSSMSRDDYCEGVERIRGHIRAGDVYQVTLCRVLSAPLPPEDGAEPDASALAVRLAAGNPAPYAGGIHVPAGSHLPPVWVVTASPELFVRVRDGRIASGPIKGTARTPEGLSAKDRAENVMIADMVRNDLQRVCLPGTVEVSALLAVEQHPGLVHLVTTVEGVLRENPVDWAGVLRATYPPASVSGAPKHTALQVIAATEQARRGPYCGAIGWVDADAGRAELAVGIRTFWWTGDDGGRIHFGTGAGITWGSVSEQEWAETELKAHRLVALASAGECGQDALGPGRPAGEEEVRMDDVVVWVDGRLRDPSEPVLSAVDHGVTVGDGVFETCGVVGGVPFALTRHLARLTRSAAGIGLAPPDLEVIREGVAAVVGHHRGLGRVRITVTAGMGPLGSGRSAGPPTVIVVGGPARPPAPARVVRVPWTRNERSAVAGLKTTSYVENVVVLAHAVAQGADEAVLANTVGDLCEGTGGNVFVERDGQVLTPALSSGCLAGITRELVLEWSAEAGLPVREAAPGELPYAILDEVVAGRAHLSLSGSVRTVVPVVALDGVPVSPGPVMAQVQRMYLEREARDVDP